jgi:predicted enzyme related to lactoylglutathione lyase
MATGKITHVEIPADDVERAKRFYSAVAGWEFGETEGFPGYFMFRTGEASGGAVGKRGEAVGTVIRDYITVANLDEASSTAERLGGKIVSPPAEVPGMGRWATVLDSEGNEIGLWEEAQGG